MKTNKFEELFEIATGKTVMLPSILENLIYVYAESLSQNEYKSGIWESILIENEDVKFWYFLLSENRVWKVKNEYRQGESNITTKCFSLVVFTFALNHFMNEFYKDLDNELGKEVHKQYNTIRYNVHLVLDKDEVKTFYEIID